MKLAVGKPVASTSSLCWFLVSAVFATGCGRALNVSLDMADVCAQDGFLDIGRAPTGLPHACTVTPPPGVVVCRDAGGIYAMYGYCRNEMCILDVTDAALTCPCHGPDYDFNGQSDDPTDPSLIHVAVCVDPSGDVWVNQNTSVPANQRTPVD
jgi:nitrite reductase/ring-hydroxylating ferredoxin subunit